MTKKRIVLVTGVAGYWGAQVAGRLIAEGERSENGAGQTAFQVIGLDNDKPETEIKGLDFIQADVRNPLLVDLLREENIFAVCHLLFKDSVHPSEASFDINVIGTMKVLGACAEAGVRKVILKSSTMVYGAQPANPSFLTEQHPLKGSRSSGSIRDMVEIEAFCNGYRRQVPEMMISILRFPGVVGPSVNSPMTRFLHEQLTPVLMGFDPIMQVIHERDVVEAILHAVVNDVPGVFNVAAEGVMPLSKLMALAGKASLPVFHLLAYWGTGILGSRRPGLSRYIPIELDYIRYPWVADLARMRQDLGFVPRFTAEEALREFAGQQRLRGVVPEAAALAYDEERLRDTIERRRRAREAQAASHVSGIQLEDDENDN